MKRRRPRRPRPLATYLSGRTRTRRFVGAAGILLVILLIVLDRAVLYRGGEVGRYEGRAWRVVRVIDGDTLEINAPDVTPTGDPSPTTRVRLWGVDTPERARADTGEPAEPFAEAATALARDLCEGKTVELQLQPHRVRGNFGRLLAYVILDDGTTLNERLLAAGLARADDRFSHQWDERYLLIEDQARKERVGMWGRGE